MVFLLNNMADAKPGSFSKTVQKHAGRAKERFLQNLGRADRTHDELFEIHANNFNKQQNAAMKLQKEFKNYCTCLKAMQNASKSLMDTLSEIYEQEWVGHEQIPVKAQTLELLWEDFAKKLNDQITLPLNHYMNQFPEIRGKIAKRGRKLVDYDSSRHNLEALETNPKKRDEFKIAKARMQVDTSKRLYEMVNRELHDILPALYESRIPFLVSSLQTLFSAEAMFHSENAKIFMQLSDVMDKLTSNCGIQRTNFVHNRPPSPRSPNATECRTYEEIEFKRPDMDKGMSSHYRVPVSQTNGDAMRSASPNKLAPADLTQGRRTPSPSSAARKSYEPVDVASQMERLSFHEQQANMSSAQDGRKVEELYDIPVGATTTDLPPGVLYRVRATYKYAAEDVDELSFEGGEVICVIEYEDPEEQEEGWLMGVKESTGEKGLFPANFTRPI